MRQRLRSWPIRVYRYRVYLPSPLPAAVWGHAHAMRRLWNRLVELDDRTEIVAHPCLAQNQRGCRCEGCTARRAAWQVLTASWRDAMRAAGLDWVSGPDVLDRFLTTVRSRRVPRARHRLDRVTIGHRFTAGGLPVSGLWSPRASRLSIVPVPDRAYRDQSRQARRERVTEARMTLAGARVDFRVRLHRLLPETAIVKRATFCGERSPLGRWTWHLNITVEEPPTSPVRGRIFAALDLGWRKFPDYVRIGMLSTGDEMIELRLPLDAPTAHTRRHALPASYPALEDYDRQIAKLLDGAKAALRPFIVPLGFALMRQGALVRWLQRLDDPRCLCGTDHATDPRVAILRAWRAENDRLRSLKLALWSRILGRRRWYYENLAAWLGRACAAVAWEATLDVKRMAEAKKSAALEAGDRARQWAAIGGLRTILARQAQMLPGVTAYSTRRCHVCGADTEPGAERILTCQNGHAWDQDDNAARNLFSQIPALIEQDERLQSQWVERRREPLVIPACLRAVAVPVHAG